MSADLREDRWQSLVQGAFLLEEQLGRVAGEPPSPEERQRRVRELLDGLLEVFPSAVDPVDDFEGYAVRRLLLALSRSLDVTALR